MEVITMNDTVSQDDKIINLLSTIMLSLGVALVILSFGLIATDEKDTSWDSVMVASAACLVSAVFILLGAILRKSKWYMIVVYLGFHFVFIFIYAIACFLWSLSFWGIRSWQ